MIILTMVGYNLVLLHKYRFQLLVQKNLEFAVSNSPVKPHRNRPTATSVKCGVCVCEHVTLTLNENIRNVKTPSFLQTACTANHMVSTHTFFKHFVTHAATVGKRYGRYAKDEVVKSFKTPVIYGRGNRILANVFCHRQSC